MSIKMSQSKMVNNANVLGISKHFLTIPTILHESEAVEIADNYTLVSLQKEINGNHAWIAYRNNIKLCHIHNDHSKKVL